MLQLRLQQRRTREQLVDQGIMPRKEHHQLIINRIENTNSLKMGVIAYNLNVVCCSSEEPGGIPRADSEFGEGQGKAPSMKNKPYKF